MQRYVTIEKQVGQTPLECMEAWRTTQSPALDDTPLTYAGRLDPMASGMLLILIGEECKNQDQYRNLDKEYQFEVLFSMQSDTADILGLVSPSTESGPAKITRPDLTKICRELKGDIELPYPHYSSKTVQGKALHTWALEGRIGEITIPTKTSTIHSLHCTSLYNISKSKLYQHVTKKIETIAPVTNPSKSLGNDFRRPDVRASWRNWYEADTPTEFQIAKFTCIASSGTYMRTLAEVIAKACNTTGLAYSIHRTKIGIYAKIPLLGGIWKKRQ